jgi:hypothetical protein
MLGLESLASVGGSGRSPFTIVLGVVEAVATLGGVVSMAFGFAATIGGTELGDADLAPDVPDVFALAGVEDALTEVAG